MAVDRYTNSLTPIKGNFDISIQDGVQLSMQKLSWDGHGLSDLHNSIMFELQRLPWLAPPQKAAQTVSASTRVTEILKGFHKCARQLLHRYNERETIIIQDEYDVQDLLHSVLRMFFADIRPEEYTPSYAGGASRLDFLLKAEKIVIEAKMTSPKTKDRQVGEQLIVDIKRYQAHPECETLFCFVYDPGGFLKNPAGLAKDLSGKHDNLAVRVVVIPT